MELGEESWAQKACWHAFVIDSAEKVTQTSTEAMTMGLSKVLGEEAGYLGFGLLHILPLTRFLTSDM